MHRIIAIPYHTLRCAALQPNAAKPARPKLLLTREAEAAADVGLCRAKAYPFLGTSTCRIVQRRAVSTGGTAWGR